MLVEVPPPGVAEFGVVDFCNSGADIKNGTKPCAWIAVSIQAQGSCTPDANGHMLHGVMKFYIPGLQACGSRRRCLKQYAPDGVVVNETMDVAFDVGCGWIGSKAALFLRGGTPGDVYDVVVTEMVPRDECDIRRVIDVYEDPWRFRLTSYIAAAGTVPFPAPLPYHQWFYPIAGTAAVGGVNLTTLGEAGKIPLSSPAITVQTGIYVTGGAL